MGQTFDKWMAIDNDSGYPVPVLCKPRTGELVAKPERNVFSKEPVGAVNLVGTEGDEAAEDLLDQFETQYEAEVNTVAEAIQAAEEDGDEELADSLEQRYARLYEIYFPMEPAPAAEPEKAGQGTIAASEAAVKLAEAEGIDLALIEGSGKDGSITKADVEAAIAGQ